jgi:microcystin-dependent protein
MSHIGVIKMIAWSVDQVGGLPQNWKYCHGDQLSVSEYNALFKVIGTTYGGDGVNNFNLPNMQCLIPFGTGALNGSGNTISLGETGGSSQLTLTSANLPSHTHIAQATQPTAQIKVSSVNASEGTPAVSSSIATPGSIVGRSYQSTLGFNTSTPNTNLSNSSMQLGSVSVQNFPAGSQFPEVVTAQPPFIGLNFIICISDL